MEKLIQIESIRTPIVHKIHMMIQIGHDVILMIHLAMPSKFGHVNNVSVP